MDDKIRQIAARLHGLREALNISVKEMADAAMVSEEEYLLCENGEKDIPVSLLHNISGHFNVEMTALLFGEEPRMRTYYLTRKGQGVAIERTKAYKYQSLAAGFAGRNADPFIVTVEPCDNPICLNTHAGQEFNYVIEGRMLLEINGKELILEEGDSLYFNAELKHGMKALDNKTVRFLAVII
ncbi:helix-turn-helix domain-containing protein [Paludibacter jiangxiensis]|uniref:Cupin domain-containing protein n=1 Tax=Paludibacter jiangxiensis TaxID=681398 RepID=A0A170YN38_9BACT|nr:XRE family transcriptional regulator [Paludibacter jiangxiensis]GAT61928.1 cupin domain-containing protein [Paludibacter jiangxiensis]